MSPLNTTDNSESGDDSFGDSSDFTLLNRNLLNQGMGMGLGMDYLVDEVDEEGILPPDAGLEIDFDKLGKRKHVKRSGDFDDEFTVSKNLKV